MKRRVLPMLVLCLLLLGGGFLSPAQPARAQADVWTPGLYQGWVYFLERTDFDYSASGEGWTATDVSTLYEESHGNLECNIHDADGTGSCSASFPMDKVIARQGRFTSKDCNATWTEGIRAVGTSNGPSLASLTYSPIGGGFTTTFSPESGPSYFNINIQASGAPTCRSQAASGQTEVGITQWDDLEYKIGFHSALSAGGTCNMPSFPRNMNVNNATITATIVECRWMMFFFDPYATFPQE